MCFFFHYAHHKSDSLFIFLLLPLYRVIMHAGRWGDNKTGRCGITPRVESSPRVTVASFARPLYDCPGHLQDHDAYFSSTFKRACWHSLCCVHRCKNPKIEPLLTTSGTVGDFFQDKLRFTHETETRSMTIGERLSVFRNTLSALILEVLWYTSIHLCVNCQLQMNASRDKWSQCVSPSLIFIFQNICREQAAANHQHRQYVKGHHNPVSIFLSHQLGFVRLILDCRCSAYVCLTSFIEAVIPQHWLVISSVSIAGALTIVPSCKVYANALVLKAKCERERFYYPRISPS